MSNALPHTAANRAKRPPVEKGGRDAGGAEFMTSGPRAAMLSNKPAQAGGWRTMADGWDKGQTRERQASSLE